MNCRVFWPLLLSLMAATPCSRAAGYRECMTWSRRTDVGNPGPQSRHAMAYNPDRQRAVLFTSDAFADLWEYDGRQWLRVFVTGPRPSPRLDAAVAYDRARRELVLVGGFGRNENDLLADTWTCRFTTDATGNVVGTWSRRADFPDFARPDAHDPSGQKGEAGARAEHTLVYDESQQVVRLFGGKARIVRGSPHQSTYNRENYSFGAGSWNGSTWIDRTWNTTLALSPNDPDVPYFTGPLLEREELGRKLIAATFDPTRRQVITYGGLRQIYQRRTKDNITQDAVNESYVESIPFLQYIPSRPGTDLFYQFPARGHFILEGAKASRCGQNATRRVFGAQLVYDTWRDRYVAFGGGYVIGAEQGGMECSPESGIDSTTYQSRLVPSDSAFKDWAPRTDDQGSPDATLLDLAGPLSGNPASRIGHTMVFDEHRGVTVLYGGSDGTLTSIATIGSETWEYAPDTNRIGFASEPPALTELCLGDTLTLQAPLRTPWTYFDRDTTSDYGFRWWFNGTQLPGATNETLVITNLSRAHSGDYQCQFIDSCGTVSLTRLAKVRVAGPPEITQQPVSQHVCPGDDAESIFFFESEEPATVQWFRVGLDVAGTASAAALSVVPGADSNVLAFRGMQPAQSGYFRARVTNRCGSAWSSIIEMTAGVWIKRQPRGGTNEVCTATTLSVVASGKGPLRLQWRRNGEPLSDSERIPSTSSNLITFTSLRYVDDAAFDCVLSDACHSVTSQIATLTITPNPPFLLSDTNGPVARRDHAMVFDASRQVTVLFGGMDRLGNFLNDLWEYDGTRWIQRALINAPAPRIHHALAYDRHRARTVLFGGSTFSPENGRQPSSDTWEYDGTNWLKLAPANAPAPRHNHTLFYDPIRRVTTLYGGDTQLTNPRAGDLWTWNGSQWTPVVVTGERPQFGPFGSTPQPRMVWDERRACAVLPPTSLNTGNVNNDYATWTWDGTRWTRRPYVFEGYGRAPSAAGSGLCLVYDTFRGEVIYWTGDGSDQAFVWRWNGEVWRADRIEDWIGFHQQAAAAYDTRRHAVVMFGGNAPANGSIAAGLSPRTFERPLADLPVLLRQPHLIDGTAPHPLHLRVVAAGAPPLRFQWRRDGVPLAEGFPFTGTRTAELTVDRALAADAGRYHCVIGGACGEVSSRSIDLRGQLLPETTTLTLNLTLSSAPVGSRPNIALAWNQPEVVLEVAPSPTGPWTARPEARSPYAPALTETSAFFRLRGP